MVPLAAVPLLVVVTAAAKLLAVLLLDAAMAVATDVELALAAVLRPAAEMPVLLLAVHLPVAVATSQEVAKGYLPALC